MLISKGVNPADCELDTWVDGVSVIHSPTRSDFHLELQPHRYLYMWRVTDGPDPGEGVCENWDDVLEQLGYWAEEAEYVNDTPDFWEELKRAPEILAAAQSAGASNAPFTPEEQAEVSNRLDAIKQLVRQQFELTGDQLAAVDQKVDELKEATTRVGRKDWVVMVNGALLSLIVNDVVPAHVVQSLFSMLITGIGHLFGIGGPPPVIGP
jgi:hypothetical protein